MEIKIVSDSNSNDRLFHRIKNDEVFQYHLNYIMTGAHKKKVTGENTDKNNIHCRYQLLSESGMVIKRKRLKKHQMKKFKRNTGTGSRKVPV